MFLVFKTSNELIKHTIDVQQAPRKQLPYLTDENKIISDSNQIIQYLIQQINYPEASLGVLLEKC